MNENQLIKNSINLAKLIVSVTFMYFIFFMFTTYVPFIAKYDRLVVITDSMKPVIGVNEIVFINTDFDHSEIQRNDIYAFYVDRNGNGKEQIVIHYIDQVISSNGENTYKTRPNIDNAQDSWTLQERDLIGVYTFGIPKVGKLLLFTQSGLGKVVIITDILIIYFLFSVLKNEKKPKENIFTDDIEQYNK